MEEILKENKSKSHKEFEKLLAEDLVNRKFKEGEITIGTVEEIGKKFVFIDLGLKSSGAIPVAEFNLTKSLDKITVGSKIEVLLEKIENKHGEVVVSHEKATRAKSWKKIEAKFSNKEEIQAMIIQKCKGGFICDYNSVLCFLPSSQLDLRPLRDISHLMKVPQTFEIVKVDNKRKNIVLSRRSILERTRDKDKDKILATMKEGDVVNGIVKNLTEWGAFVDLNGMDSLLHITDISWSRINKPSELLSIGQSIKVKITKIDQKTKKVSTSIKHLTEDPYLKIINKYEIGKQYTGVVTKIMEYGVFCKLEDSLEGLIHSSELSWTKKNIHPGKLLTTSQQITVELLEKDLEKRRVSLSYKNTLVNPWVKFSKDHKVGNELKGSIKNITDYGLFVSIDNSELDGLIHYKDLNWNEKESELEKYKRNQIISFKILEINKETEKIRLGIKQLSEDSFQFFMDKNVSDIITVIVDSSVQNGIYVHAGKKNFSILIKKNQLAKEAENQRPARFVKGDKLDMMITELKKDERKVSLSIKALEEKLTKEAVKKYGSKDSGGVLGDILGKALNLKKKKKK